VAEELNLRGVPTYAASGRGRRTEATQAHWRHGRVGNMVRNPIYKGCQLFGRRNGGKSDGPRRPRPLIRADIEPLVSEQLWAAAQETLARNRTIARNTVRRYVLRGVIHCASCGLMFVGQQGRPGVHWYRCGGRTIARGPLVGRCSAPLLRGDAIEPAILAEIERWLRDPGDVLDEIDAHDERDGQRAAREADRRRFGQLIEGLDAERTKALALAIRGHLSDLELDAQLARIAAQRAGLERRLSELQANERDEGPHVDVDLLQELRARVAAGLTEEQWQAIVRLLVRVVVHHEVDDAGARHVRASIEYRFPQAVLGVLQTRTGTDSSPRQAPVWRTLR
jgi:hypothetical protein